MEQDRRPSKGMRGYFGIGVERLSKPANLGNLFRSAHAFGASFVFIIGAHPRIRELLFDTSKSAERLPCFVWASAQEMSLPKECRLVGVELTEDAIDLPSFPHPLRAAYVLGAELGGISPALLTRCDYVVRIPSAFSLNVAIAGAIVMYDRIRSLGRFPPRPFAIESAGRTRLEAGRGREGNGD
jgi:tRNA G18 (ribose-2'-O)-methylase SpoU